MATKQVRHQLVSKSKPKAKQNMGAGSTPRRPSSNNIKLDLQN